MIKNQLHANYPKDSMWKLLEKCFYKVEKNTLPHTLMYKGLEAMRYMRDSDDVLMEIILEISKYCTQFQKSNERIVKHGIPPVIIENFKKEVK